MDISDHEYDVIVVGLGCAGISTCYYYSKKHPDARVLGIEMNSDSGGPGSSSYGMTRNNAYHYGSKYHEDLRQKSNNLWDEIESETNFKIRMKAVRLTVTPNKGAYIETVRATNRIDKFLTNTEIMQMYPGIENLPDNCVGFLESDAHIMYAKTCLMAIKKLALK